MTAQGPKRAITFSGKSIISVIAEYTVSLDLKIMGAPDAGNVARDYILALSNSQKNLSIEDFMIKTWDFFVNLGANSNAVSSAEMEKIAANFIGGLSDCIETGSEKDMHYPIANAPFNQSNNVIANLWRNILPEPVYEIFAYCDRETGKPKIMARESPFGCKETGNKDWSSLDIFEIDPIALIDYELNQSDEEVYTVFSAYLIGSAMSREFNIGKEQDKQDDIFAKDEEKLAVYGYKPLEVSFRGYDTQYTRTDDRKKTFAELNKKAKYWYARLDDMYSGSLTLATDFIKPKDEERDRNPRIGCRAKFLGGEFYITRATHRWQYGGTPTITLSVSRGMKYDEDGYQREGADGVLSDIGKRYKELE
jgi:hypothetical protein